MIGSTLKFLRKDKNIPIRLICNGVMDEANYWRLENNKIETSFTTVMHILERLNVTLEEFQKLADLDIALRKKEWEKRLYTAFNSKNSISLYKLRHDIAVERATHDTIYLTHLEALSSLYLARIAQKDYDEHDKKVIRDYLFRCNNWGKYEITLLNNTLFIFADADVCFELYSKAYQTLSKLPEDEQVRVIPLSINMISLLILCQENAKVRQIVEKISRLTIDDKYVYYSLCRKWVINIANYYLKKDEDYLIEAKKVVKLFKLIDMTTTFDRYNAWTKDYEKLVNTYFKADFAQK